MTGKSFEFLTYGSQEEAAHDQRKEKAQWDILEGTARLVLEGTFI